MMNYNDQNIYDKLFIEKLLKFYNIIKRKVYKISNIINT